MTVDMNIEFNKSKTLAEAKARYSKGIKVATSELRRYANQYVRFLTGKTKDSSYIASDLSKGLVVYDTPYARYAYYNTTNKVTRDHNPNAQPLWGDYAIKHHLKDIERTVQREVKKP